MEFREAIENKGRSKGVSLYQVNMSVYHSLVLDIMIVISYTEIVDRTETISRRDEETMTLITRRSFPALEDVPATFRSLEDTFNRFFSEAPASRPWTPAVDIQENENELLLTADVPGIAMENIDISIEDGALTLSGERKFENEENKGGYHRIERSYGGFKRVFTLPDSVDAEKVSAAYNAGVLKVTLPKKEAAKPRTIKVSVNK